jgi:predicted DNA-binding protein (UPF0251 family)
MLIIYWWMSRPPRCRFVGEPPRASVFKPIGTPTVHLERVDMTVDELEALRLSDLEGMYQDAAAGRMRISRATFARTAESARRKVAEALVHGKALVIGGGPVHYPGERCECAERRCRRQSLTANGCGGAGKKRSTEDEDLHSG